MRKTTLFFTALLLVVNTAASAGSIDALLGEWVSPDGQAKQTIERQLDGSWLSTRMWFQSGNGWKLVGVGALYRKPNEEHWYGITRTIDMDGIELFESTLSANGHRQLAMRNRAFQGDGSVIETEEDWRFLDADRYEYTIYKIEGTERHPWFVGSWVRTEN